MQDALARAQGQAGVFAGQVWWVPDRLVDLGEGSTGFRTFHDQRPVIIMQGDDIGQNRYCGSVVVMPCSSKVELKEQWETVLQAEESALDEASVVKVHLIQPIKRSELLAQGQFVGDIDAAALQRIRFLLIYNLGVISSIPES